MNIYQSNNYRKDLSWLHFNDDPGFQEKQQVKSQQSCISVFVAYPTIPSRTNQGSNFLGGSFSNRDNEKLKRL